jgi:predicted Zn finger-like uncharacterized protein
LRLACHRTNSSFGSWGSDAGVSGLIVTCEECSTSFQLDEARIPASGAQVRCSRCKHAFYLANPSASQSEEAHAIAEEAAADANSGVPPVASDVASTEASGLDGAPAPGDADEEDWQFNEEIRVEGDDNLDAADGFGGADDFADELDADALMADISPEDLESEIGSIPAVEPEIANMGAEEDSGLDVGSESAGEVGGRDESAFGSVDDFSSLMEDDDVAPVDLGGEIEAELEREASKVAKASTYASGGTSDDLGDPESWDLVGSDAPVTSKTAIGALGSSFEDELAGVGLGFGDGEEDGLYDDAARKTSPLWQGLRGVGNIVGWALTLALIAGVLGLGLRSEWHRSIQSPQVVSAGPMTAETTAIRWVETTRSGFVMVVDGELRNTGRAVIQPGRVQLALLDGAGHRLAIDPILAGAPLSRRELRESAPNELSMSAAGAAMRLRDTPLAPGTSRPFVALVREEDLPEDARRVLLEISDAEIVPVRRDAQVEVTPMDPDSVGPILQGADSAGSAGIDPDRAGDQLVDESDFSP